MDSYETPRFKASKIKDVPSDKKEIQSSHYNLGELKILKKICRSRFPIYLAWSAANKCCVWVKCYPYESGKTNKSYRRESRFISLSHPYLLEIHSIEPSSPDMYGKGWSFIVMEQASYGNLYSLIVNGKFPADEILVRTYFQQLVQGVEFLHSHRIAHMDLRLENLFIGKDRNLRIFNFAYSQVQDEEPIKQREMDGYKAPEIRRGDFKDPFAADIYAMGVLLFIMKFQHFPYLGGASDQPYQEENWEVLYKIHSGGASDEKDPFRTLFLSMVETDPMKRASLRKVKESSWYRKEVYGNQHLVKIAEHWKE
jgi:Protein kinase domain.